MNELERNIDKLISKSTSYSLEHHPEISYVKICRKWRTEYLIKQIIQTVIEHLENFPKENIVSPAQHTLLIKYLKGDSNNAYR